MINQTGNHDLYVKIILLTCLIPMGQHVYDVVWLVIVGGLTVSMCFYITNVPSLFPLFPLPNQAPPPIHHVSLSTYSTALRLSKCHQTIKGNHMSISPLGKTPSKSFGLICLLYRRLLGNMLATRGNHYCSRDYGSSAPNQNSYHYSNKQVLFFHKVVRLSRGA